MSPKQLARLAMVLGALLLLWGAASLARKSSRGPSAADRFALPTVSADSADSIIIVRPADTTRLVRRDSTRWTVNGHPAAQRAVADLFTALADTTRTSELVAGRTASHAGYGVDTAKGARVQVMRGNSTLIDLVQGKRAPTFDGGYFRSASDSAVYLVGGNLAQTLELSSDEWRDKRIAGTVPDSVGRIDVSRGKRSYSLRRDGKGWIWGSGGRADSAAVGTMLEGYAGVEAAGFATAAQADSASFARPDRRATLLRTDGTPLLAIAFDSTASGFWVRSERDSTVYRMDGWAVDRLTPADSTLKGK